MTRTEKILVTEIQNKFPEEYSDDILRWLYTINSIFDNLTPIDFEKKYGGKRFKKRLIKVIGIN